MAQRTPFLGEIWRLHSYNWWYAVLDSWGSWMFEMDIRLLLLLSFEV